MFEQPRYSSSFQLRLMRLLVVLAFLLLLGRLYQLQIVQRTSYQAEADQNRFRIQSIAPPRGVIYDRNGEILVRNRPSFVISVVPADLPQDDLDTDYDEEALALQDLLEAMGADTDINVILSIQAVMFRRLGYLDYVSQLERAGVNVVYLPIDEEARLQNLPEFEIAPLRIPDISDPLPLNGLVALVQRAVTLARQGSAFESVPILRPVSREKAFFIAEQSFRLPGVKVDQVPVREYVYGELTSHLLGFMGPIPAADAQLYTDRGYANPNESVGLSGLEYEYQDLLRGTPGQEVLEVDILGRVQRTVGEPVPPVPGQNLVLSIDVRLQRVMQNTLLDAVRAKGETNAVSIAINPQTGEILGLVSLPAFDNNVMAEGLGAGYVALEQDPDKPLINYAIGGLYPPGSTFKIVTATGALEEGVISPSSIVTDNGPLFLPNRFFPNDLTQAQKFVSWNHKYGINHGRINVVQALALSNDIFFYWVGGGYLEFFQGMGEALLAKWSALFGYGELSGIDLPGEVSADIPDDQWKRQVWAESWVTGDSYNMAIGQGYLLSTPLEVLMSIVPIANGGTLYEPRLVRQVVDAQGGLQQDYAPVVKRELNLQPTTLETVRQGLWSAVNVDYGTAPNGRIPGVIVAAKTGTAEFCEWVVEDQDCLRDKDDNLLTHAWYVAYAPYDDPQIAVVVFVYNGGEGSETATPVATKIMQTYFELIRPDLIQP